MKRFLVAVCIGGLTGPVLTAAAERFSQAVRREDFSAAGLAKLTPEELARLDTLVGDYKSGALLAARREAERAEQARVAAEAKASRVAAEAQAAKAAAEARAAKAEAAAAEPKKSEGGLLAKAKALLPAGTAVEYAAIESRLVGDFTGWHGRAVFVLENGQRWQMANPDDYYTPPVKSPAVKIAPSSMGGYWMTIEGVSQRVRVVPVGGGR